MVTTVHSLYQCSGWHIWSNFTALVAVLFSYWQLLPILSWHLQVRVRVTIRSQNFLLIDVSLPPWEISILDIFLKTSECRRKHRVCQQAQGSSSSLSTVGAAWKAAVWILAVNMPRVATSLRHLRQRDDTSAGGSTNQRVAPDWATNESRAELGRGCHWGCQERKEMCVLLLLSLTANCSTRPRLI